MKAAHEAQMRSRLARFCVAMGIAIFAGPVLGFGSDPAIAQDAEIAKTDSSIDALDPGIKLFLREKMAAGQQQVHRRQRRPLSARRNEPLHLRFRSAL